MLLVVMADYFSTFLKSDTIVGVEVKSGSETKAGRLWYTDTHVLTKFSESQFKNRYSS